MEPDFKALARAWVDNDPRTRDISEEQSSELVARLATALERRRKQVGAPESSGGDLVISVDRSRLDDHTGVDRDALRQVTEFVREISEKEDLLE